MLKRPIPLAITAFVLLFVAAPSVIAFYTDWLWFGEVGYQSVYGTILRTQAGLFTAVFAIAALWIDTNLRVALRSVRESRPLFVTRQGMEVAVGASQLRVIANAASIVVAVLIGFYASSEWAVWQMWRHATPFGVVDPVLGHDVSFYVFSLPFFSAVVGLGETLVVIGAIGAGAVYLISSSSVIMLPARPTLPPGARRHLALLAAAFFALLALSTWLHRAEFLIQPSGVIYGASYADVYARLPANAVLIAVTALGAVLVLVQAFSPRRRWPLVVAIALYILVSIAGGVYSGVLQRFVVTPNEQARESPFIQHNIDATRRAFDLDRVDTSELSGDALLTRDDITRNATTLQNVRLWDHQPLLQTFGQIQEIRTYYDFVSVDNDRYVIGGAQRQVMLSARELNPNSLPNRTWVNERLTFTHGYGLTLGPVNQVTREGLPVLFVQNMPPETTGGLKIDEPSLYFGELSNDYVIVRTRTREFHYPRGDENVFTQYAGRGGVPINGLWRKLLFAFRFGSYQIVLSDAITPESRIMFNRNIRDRVRAIAPFLTFDRDPYLALADGRLVWLYDAYTTSDRYPYSTPGAGGVNYIRNAVKFAIDAYDGTTTAYVSDERDPIVRTYSAIFPELFKPLAQMPASLRAHVRYPEDIFAIQSAMYATYHMTQPAVFYNREDQWEVPAVDQTADGRGESDVMQPYYTIMKLPNEPDPEFIQMLPFTPRRRDNLAAWLVAHSDGDHYGRLSVFQFPKQKLIFGPRQVVARINQDQTISPTITLWNQQGSEVLWGTLMVIPIEESLIYVRPLYLRGSGGRIPELRRVVVAYQNQIVMEETLDAALARLFGGAAPSRPPEDVRAPQPPPGGAAPPAPGPTAPPSQTSLATEARDHYDRAIAAQRAGDWAKYGEELKLLGQTIERMNPR